MILFYSEYCLHCKILLETIKKHDSSSIIKTVSIDTLRTLKKPIDPKIHSVPALLLLNTKEYLFGKAVFDYLLLPNRGVLFATQLTRDKKPKDSIANNDNLSQNKALYSGNPQAFTLGSITAEYFSSIDDSNNIITDKNYNWDLINNDNAIKDDLSTFDIEKPKTENNDKDKLPTIEEIMKQRANDVL
jgi:uncharacterized membrane protein YcgQ (UPF0703/DUF1980 family)